MNDLPMEPMQRRPDAATTFTRERMLEAALAVLVEQNNAIRGAHGLITLNESTRVFGASEVLHGLSLGWTWTSEGGALCGRRES